MKTRPYLDSLKKYLKEQLKFDACEICFYDLTLAHSNVTDNRSPFVLLLVPEDRTRDV